MAEVTPEQASAIIGLIKSLWGWIKGLKKSTPTQPTPPPVVVPPTPIPDPLMNLHFWIVPAGARIGVRTSAYPEVWQTGIVNEKGYVMLTIPEKTTVTPVTIQAEGYVRFDGNLVAERDKTYSYSLTKVYPEVSTNELIRANYCGHKTPWGEVCFDIFIPTYTLEQRQQIYDLKRKMGLKHIVLAVKGDYRGDRPFDFTQDHGGFLNIIKEVILNGFCPIIALSSGDRGTGSSIWNYLESLIEDLKEVHLKCHWFPGWEVVKGGWTSKELSKVLIFMRDKFTKGSALWFHGSDTRPCGSSNPLEPDDPWQGDEAGFWKDFGGDGLIGLFYQTESGEKLLLPNLFPADLVVNPEYAPWPGYLTRLFEISIRALIGGRGWRKTRVCVFETIAEDFYAGRCQESAAKTISDKCRELGFVEFGNG